MNDNMPSIKIVSICIIGVIAAFIVITISSFVNQRAHSLSTMFYPACAQTDGDGNITGQTFRRIYAGVIGNNTGDNQYSITTGHHNGTGIPLSYGLGGSCTFEGLDGKHRLFNEHGDEVFPDIDGGIVLTPTEYKWVDPGPVFHKFASLNYLFMTVFPIVFVFSAIIVIFTVLWKYYHGKKSTGSAANSLVVFFIVSAVPISVVDLVASDIIKNFIYTPSTGLEGIVGLLIVAMPTSCMVMIQAFVGNEIGISSLFANGVGDMRYSSVAATLPPTEIKKPSPSVTVTPKEKPVPRPNPGLRYRGSKYDN